MKFLIVFALAFAIVSARDFYLRSIEVPVLENEGRIVDGKKAAPGQFPYQVGLSVTKRTFTTWCGGSLIGVNWVLTAAHCADGALEAEIYLGATQLSKAEKVYNASKSDMIIHPDWNSWSIKNDIALVRIPTTSESGTIGIVRIPRNNNLKYLGELVVFTGWGYINDNTTELSPILQYGILEVSPGSDCRKVYSSYAKDDTRICVDASNGVSACEADSGGPLVLEGKNIQIGVLSFGYRFGCTLGKPFVFTRVSEYIDWIKSHTQMNY